MRAYLPVVGVSVATVIAVLAFFSAGFFVRGMVDQRGGNTPPIAQSSAEGSIVEGVSVDDDPFQGPEDAPVVVVEFSDFQCPFCQRHFEQTLPLLVEAYGDRVRYVFRDFPIEAIHPQAPKAAEAAQCASDQGQFWEYHDLLFLNQEALDLDDLKTYADYLGLDSGSFNQCLDSGKYTQEVADDISEGLSYGVNGTPTFFINGRTVLGAQPFSVFQEIIDAELAESGRSPSS